MARRQLEGNVQSPGVRLFATPPPVAQPCAPQVVEIRQRKLNLYRLKMKNGDFKKHSKQFKKMIDDLKNTVGVEKKEEEKTLLFLASLSDSDYEVAIQNFIATKEELTLAEAIKVLDPANKTVSGSGQPGKGENGKNPKKR